MRSEPLSTSFKPATSFSDTPVWLVRLGVRVHRRREGMFGDAACHGERYYRIAGRPGWFWSPGKGGAGQPPRHPDPKLVTASDHE